METLRQDVRYGVRMLRKNPGFALVAVTALALGIGANTAIFSVVYGVLLRPLPYPNAERLSVASLSVPDFRDLKEQNTVFDALAIWASNLYNLAGTEEVEQVRGAVVSPEFFSILGQAAAGRTFRPEEDRAPLVVLSHGLWQRRFGGNPAILGQGIDLSGRSHTIVGVMPADFQFPSAQFELWVTFGSALAGTPEQAENRQLRIFRCLARLRPGVSLELAQADVDAISRRLEKEYPNTNAGVQIQFTPLYERIVGDARPALLILLGAVGFVLLIACANVANLMLARTAAREREIAIRSALGAGRGRLIRQLLTESLRLASAGGLCGLLLARWGIDFLLSLKPGEIPRLSTIGLSFPVLLFTLSISLATGMLFGIIPALQASRRKQFDMLKETGRGLAGSPWGNRIRAALVVAEVALSLIVLIGAGLLVRSGGAAGELHSCASRDPRGSDGGAASRVMLRVNSGRKNMWRRGIALSRVSNSVITPDFWRE